MAGRKRTLPRSYVPPEWSSSSSSSDSDYSDQYVILTQDSSGPNVSYAQKHSTARNDSEGNRDLNPLEYHHEPKKRRVEEKSEMVINFSILHINYKINNHEIKFLA